jgi:integrase
LATYRKKLRADGTSVWHVQIRKRGVPPLTQTFARITDARAWVAEQEFFIRQGECLPIILAKRRLLSEAIDRFIAEDLEKPKRRKQRRDLLSHSQFWRNQLGRYTLASVTTGVLNRAVDKLERGTTIRGTPAVGWGWLSKSPAGTATLPSVDNERVRYLSDDERRRLLDSCRLSPNRYLYPMVLLAMSTGTRLSELKGLRWNDLVLSTSSSTGTARLTNTKNKQPRAVPIAGAALNFLLAMKAAVPQQDGRFVFPSDRLSGVKPMDIRRPWENVIIVMPRRATPPRAAKLRVCASNSISCSWLGSATSQNARLAHSFMCATCSRR